MELLNATKMQAGYTMGMDSNGRESLVVAIKGTFSIPEHPDLPAELTDAQLPLIMADTFTGEPGFSAPVYEVDYSPVKPACDVLLIGGAHSSKPVQELQVGIKVGGMGKTFIVCGERAWEASAAGIYPGQPKAFTYQPISYDLAFGGIDDFLADEKRHVAFMKNPVGKGYHKHLSSNLVDGTPMPQTEEVNRRINKADGDYQPMSFGPVGRGWKPRHEFAGTYDEEWLDKQFPFLPKDFDNRYFQSAPPDQQMSYPQGGEEVILINLTPGGGRIRFRLPTIEMPVVFFRKKGEKHQTQAVIDTIVFEPDKWLFTMTWRASLPLKKNIFEIPQILVGKMSRGWWRARELGKTWYPSLAHLQRAKQKEAEEEA
ncbi:MAG: DUF2169 family type VI secretion system accessory protein [Thiolinea sp.]